MKKISCQKKKTFVVNASLSIIFIISGIMMMTYPRIGVEDPVFYLSSIFYLIGFFHVIGYFVERNHLKINYENLFNAFIYILSATFLYCFRTYSSEPILGTGLLLTVLMILINRGYYTWVLRKENNNEFVLNYITILLILFLSVLVITNLYQRLTTVQTLILGYYFITYGAICLISVFITIFINSKYFDSLLNNLVQEKQKVNEKKKIVKKKLSSPKKKKNTKKAKK